MYYYTRHLKFYNESIHTFHAKLKQGALKKNTAGSTGQRSLNDGYLS